MKKIALLAALIAASYSFSFSASAAEVCGSNYRSEMVTDPITLVISTVSVFDHTNPCEGSDPMAIVQAWGLTGHQTPMVRTGATVTDDAGMSDTCPTWYNVMGCFDLTHTNYYENQMRDIAQQTSKSGLHYADNWSYWLNN